MIGIQNHVKTHTKEYVNIALKTRKCRKCSFTARTDPEVQRHHAKVHNKTVCNICGELFIVKKAFESHKLVHEDPNKLKCKFCGKKFKILENLEKHHESHEKTRECPICLKKINSIFYLKHHMQQVHGGELMI
jgi:uncharacterized Zn-finger protein